ncbi:uncharacterized protein EDB91DRAFT_1269752 [Suillus paluster]|uniref:uncharacterized protein n=1 Tax=Suillus paluster TaxID=48578 RepID=UPI001B883F73|nr:uncharacterized protein EDB91DRAFT_1269752 [Suillus paluster]KAG1745404.1 hypothetical protein EDB91DRAFT_1269752 [Suillus paluster]
MPVHWTQFGAALHTKEAVLGLTRWKYGRRKASQRHASPLELHYKPATSTHSPANILSAHHRGTQIGGGKHAVGRCSYVPRYSHPPLAPSFSLSRELCAELSKRLVVLHAIVESPFRASLADEDENMQRTVILTADLLCELVSVSHPLFSNSLIASTYATLLTPLLTLFLHILSSLPSLIKRSLHKYTLHALSGFSALSMSQSRWKSVSFPDFLAGWKLAAVGKGGDLSVSLADIAVSTVRYPNRIPDDQDTVGSALSALGDGNWKMGDRKQVGKTPKSSSVEVNEKC